jgi:glycerol-3-phosphate acyltransferase PlsY
VQLAFLLQVPRTPIPFLGGAAIADTLGLLAFTLAFAGLYLAVTWLMHRAVGRRTPAEVLARTFVYTLIPIALAYLYAHYLSFLLIQGQLIIPLASDPFAAGWDLLGTAGYTVDISIVNARFVWIFAVAAIVAGHIVAVYLAHLRSLALYPDRGLALRSQLPLLALMVGYTVVSLWIVSRPIAE